MPETCQNWLGLINIHIYNGHQTREIYQVLSNPVDFKDPRELELWNPLSQTARSRCSFIWNIRPGNVWNYHKAQK